MSTPITDAANAISNQSPAIKRFAQLVAAKLEPPPATATRGGVGRVALGAPIVNAGPLDLIVADEGNIGAALEAKPTRALVYMAAVDVNQTVNYGVDLATAQTNGWLLKDNAGTLLRNVGYPDNYIGDVGSAGYRQAWGSHVLATVRATGAQGVYIDDVLGDTQLLIGGGYPAKYPNRAAWQAAMIAFVSVICPTLRAAGFYVVVNASAFTPGSPGSNDATDDTAWWTLIRSYVDGLTKEYWMQNPGNVDQVYTDAGTSWLGQFASWLSLPAVAQVQGAEFFTASYGNAQTLAFIRAAFLLTWDGRGGAMMPQSITAPAPFQNVGTPTDAYTRSGHVYTRPFTNGVVKLDASTGTASWQ